MAQLKTAFVTGFTGQDGTYLTNFLLHSGYRVIGLCRRVSTEPPRRIRGMYDFANALEVGKLVLVEGDLLSPTSLNAIIRDYQPDEIYNLAAQSHVGLSFKQPEFTMATILEGTMNLIHALEFNHPRNNWRMYEASTSEMYGDQQKGYVLNAETRFNPNSPYAIAKLAAHHYCQMKRGQGYFIACGILFNHESEIRGGDFVTQKIARGAVNWAKTGEPIHLGNISASRDWGYAGDYVRAMHLMLQQEHADDYIVATGENHSIKEFAELAFEALGHKLEWEGKHNEVRGLVDGKEAIVTDPAFYRPNDVNHLIGSAEKIKGIGWQPEVSFNELVNLMVEAAQ